ncbi:MAG TPA: hypothetical protein VN969_15800 [Streptosporangiaceae bacterium]|nr:hypothetical protein [Streptosporangiaceae bacterium]
MRIGYSFWGFLGPGITDTPDGGRSHRRTLVDGLANAGHDIVFLQCNRDLDEAGLDLRDRYTWDRGLPRIDALFVEWRWPVHGRNTTSCGEPGHTCDLHRQAELTRFYTARCKVPTIVWDKDLQLGPGSALRRLAHVAVCEAALQPGPGADSLLFPVADTVLSAADPAVLAAIPRPLPLVYTGNQYDRDEAFSMFFAPAAARYPHRVAGKWTRTTCWPHVNFTGRCAFPEVRALHESAVATVLLLPDRYARAGQMTQRLPEAVLAGCLPVTPATLAYASAFTPPALHASSGDEVTSIIGSLLSIAGATRHAGLIAECIAMLSIFRLSHQVTAINRILRRLTDDHPACPPSRPVTAR